MEKSGNINYASANNEYHVSLHVNPSNPRKEVLPMQM